MVSNFTYRLCMAFNLIFYFVCLVIAIAILSGCAVNYAPGDLSKNYCTTTSPETRKVIKSMLEAQGVVIGVDYCAAYTITNIVLTGGNNGN